LALCYRTLADLKRATGAAKESARYYGLARDGFARLADRNPDVTEYQAALAGTYINMADSQQGAAAIDTFGKAVAILTELVELYPENAQFRRDRAVTLRSLAVLQHAAGQPDAARKNLRTALDDLTTLTARFPDNKDFAVQLAETRKAWQALFEKEAGPKAA
jgi:tetratricopeptide (TPR) repeat protein